VSDEKADLEQRLLAAQEAVAAVESVADEKRELALLKIRVERAEQAAKDAPEIAKAEEQYGPIGESIEVVQTSMGAIVVKAPHHLHWGPFQDKAINNKLKPSDVWKLVKTCLVYPDSARVEEIIEAQSGAVARLATAVTELADIETKERAGK